MPHARSLLAAALMASATLVVAQGPICNPCVDGPEMFEHRRTRAPRVADAIVLVEPVRIAFYEAAPRAMAASMRRAVGQRCGTEQQTGQPSRPEAWYCGTGLRLRFLRAVNVLGDRYKTGLACDEQSLTPNLTFYAEDMFDEGTRCIFVAYDVKAKRHQIDLGASP